MSINKKNLLKEIFITLVRGIIIGIIVFFIIKYKG